MSILKIWNAETQRYESIPVLKGDSPVADVDYYSKATTERIIDEKLAQIPAPDVSGQIQTHNTATDAHGDIRTLVAEKQPKGDYALKSELPTVPTKVSVFENDAGYAKKSELPAVPTNVSAFTNDANYVPRSTVDTMIQDALKALTPWKIEFSKGKLYASATTASYAATSVSDNSVTFNYKGGSGVEELFYPITGLYKGRTYTIVFDETYNGSYIQDTYRYGCGIVQESEYTSGTWPSNKAIPSWIAWHTGSTGKQSGAITFTAQADTVYWAWSLGRLSDGVNVTITFNARVI